MKYFDAATESGALPATMGVSDGDGFQVAGRDNAIDEADLQSLFRLHAAGGEHDVLCAARADDVDQLLETFGRIGDPAPGGRNAQLRR